MSPAQFSRTALLVIDLQNISFIEPEAQAGREELMSHVTRMLDHARMHKWQVFFIREGFAKDLHDAPPYARNDERLVIDRPEMQFIDELTPYLNPDEEVIKTRHGAFDGTGLRERLVNRGTKNIVLVGVNTDACILATAMNGRQDFQVYVVRECVDSKNLGARDSALQTLEYKVHVMDLDDFIALSARPNFTPPPRRPAPSV